MKCPNLLKNVEDMIVNELLNPDNATIFYVDAILFKCTPIIDACEAIIQNNINEITAIEKESEFLLDLPF